MTGKIRSRPAGVDVKRAPVLVSLDAFSTAVYTSTTGQGFAAFCVVLPRVAQNTPHFKRFSLEKQEIATGADASAAGARAAAPRSQLAAANYRCLNNAL